MPALPPNLTSEQKLVLELVERNKEALRELGLRAVLRDEEEQVRMAGPEDRVIGGCCDFYAQLEGYELTLNYDVYTNEVQVIQARRAGD